MSDIVERLRGVEAGNLMTGAMQVALYRKAAAEIERLRAQGREKDKALAWYLEEADAAARYMTQDKEKTADTLIAILTVLANDGGSRARAALTSDHRGADSAVASTESKTE